MLLAVNLEKGRTYYFITYADPGFTMPGVMPVVYVGESESHQFQDTVSYQRFGSVLDTESEYGKQACITDVPESEIGTTIVSLSGAVDVLVGAHQRAEEAGEPVLAVSKGSWE